METGEIRYLKSLAKKYPTIPLAKFVLTTYGRDPCEAFHLDYREEEYDVKDAALDQKMHKAIAIIQFKLEGQLMKKRPEFQMEHRLLLDKMDLEKLLCTYREGAIVERQ